jgi:hypothetical protein
MPMPLEELVVGRCYRTPAAEVRKIVAFDGGRVIYVIELNGLAPVWNRGAWKTKPRGEFAQGVDREVMCL